MHKISVSGDIGALDWTPPQSVQDKFNRAPAELQEQVKQWMGRMIEGYVCVLLDTQRSAHGIAWLEKQTEQLVVGALALPAEPAVSSHKLN